MYVGVQVQRGAEFGGMIDNRIAKKILKKFIQIFSINCDTPR